jgi:cation diffusion facilitator family transporter
MAHNHSHHHHDTTGNIKVAFFLNSIFVVIELIGGILTNSIAILSDALHDFGDCLSLAVAWALQKKSLKKRDKFYSYGYKRFSLLGSVFLSGVLFLSSVFVVIEAIKRIQDPQSVKAGGMFLLAIIGIVINGAAALKLKKGDSLNERAVFLHVMEDVLGWASVLAVSIVMMFIDQPVLDPILSIAISIWVLYNVYSNLKSTFKIFLQAIPDGVDIDELTQLIESLDEVESIHDLHVWTMDGNYHVMTLHVVTSSKERNL